MNLTTYWEGPGPAYIADCLATVRRHTRRDCIHRHVTPERFEEYGLDSMLHPNWRNIKQLGVKSDAVRVAMLAKYGGLYVDADTVMMRSPVGVIDEASDCSFMVWTNPPRRIIAGYIYCRPGSPVAAGWLENVNRFLAEERWGWTDLGERCLTPAVDAHAATCRQIPLDTFLPIEIDREVPRFFTTDDYRDLVKEHTIAFGLNHSWMMRMHGRNMTTPAERLAGSPLLINRLLTDARVGLKQQPKITVCCVTYRRPELLGRLIASFEAQDHANREMLILDDSGELSEASGDRWRLISSPERSPTLGSKRNRLARLVSADTDAIVPWDDDDLAAPWALSAIAASLPNGDWFRPSLALVPHQDGKTFWAVETWAQPDRSDKAFHPAWGYTPGAFWGVGGYPEDASLGEDLVLARKFRDAGINEFDPLSFGFPPYYLFGPWDNEHFSYRHKDYQTWPQRLPETPTGTLVSPVPHGLHLDQGHIRPGSLKRPFQTNWWGDDVR